MSNHLSTTPKGSFMLPVRTKIKMAASKISTITVHILLNIIYTGIDVKQYIH